MTENNVRRLARRMGYVVRKSRRAIGPDNAGAFMLIDANRNAVVLGPRYDATLEEIASWLRT